MGVDKQSEERTDKDRGGRVKLTERMTVDFAPGALKQTTTITGVEYAVWVSTIGLDGKRAITGTRGLPVLQLPFELGPNMDFDAPVTVTIDLSDVVTSAMLDRGFVPELQYMRPQTAGDGKQNLIVGESVPSVFNPASRKLVARLAHFSECTHSTGGQTRAVEADPQPGDSGAVSRLGQLWLLHRYARPDGWLVAHAGSGVFQRRRRIWRAGCSCVCAWVEPVCAPYSAGVEDEKHPDVSRSNWGDFGIFSVDRRPGLQTLDWRCPSTT